MENETKQENKGQNETSIKTICNLRKTPQGYSIWIPETAFHQADILAGEK